MGTGVTMHEIKGGGDSGLLAFLTVLHPAVDACSATVLVIGGLSWKRIFVYNAIAFAVQFPLGVMLDARPRWTKMGLGMSLLLTLAGVACAACGLAGLSVLPVGLMALVLACLGNALFHLLAGKTILEGEDGRGGPIGLFISTGALGLFAGLRLAAGHGLACLSGFGAAIVVVGLMVWCRGLGRMPLARTRLSCAGSFAELILIGLFVLVAWRSWTGLAAVKMTNAAGLSFAGAGAAAVWAGKAAGGFLGDRFGHWRVTVVSVFGSLVLCVLSRPEQTVVWLLLLFVAQLATGPVLSLMYDKAGRAGGTAFGLNCLGLFMGSM